MSRDLAPPPSAAEVDLERDRKLTALATQRAFVAEMAAEFVAGFAVFVLIVCAAVWVIFKWLEPRPTAADGTATLCMLVPLASHRRVRAGSPPPEPETEEPVRSLHMQVRQAVGAAYREGLELGEELGYTSGVRAGRLAALCWGLLLGAILVAGAARLGWLAGWL